MKTQNNRATLSDQISFPAAADIAHLVSVRDAECVSIYLELAHPGTPGDANRVKLRQLVAEASEGLDRDGDVRVQVEDLEAAARSPEFWRIDAKAVAWFLGEVSEVYSLHGVPGDMAVVGTDYYVIPLIETVQTRGCFRVLAITTDGGRLFQVDGPFVRLLSEHGLPEWISPSKRLATLQFHSDPSGKSGGTGVAFHGQSASEPKKRELTRRLKAIDDWFLDQLSRGEGPLVLAGVDHVVAEFRAISKGGPFAGFTIGGGRLTADDILEKSQGFAIERHRDDVRQIQDRFRMLHGTGKASADPGEIRRVSMEGAVDVLMIRSGSFDWTEERDTTNRSDRINTTAREVILHKGKVLVVDGSDMPGPSDMTAIFRY